MKKLAVILCAVLAFLSAPRAAGQVHVREMPETAFGFFQEVGRALSESSEYDGEGGQFEFEPSFGFSLPFYGGGLKGMAGASGGIEIRYNVPDKPTDVGVELNYTITARHASDAKGLFNRSSSYCEFNAASVAVICDYNFEFGDGGVVPFIGVGGGLSKRTYAAKNPDYIHQDRPEESGVLIARVGVELFRHLRLTLDGRISGRDYNAICLRIGFAIGGGHSR